MRFLSSKQGITAVCILVALVLSIFTLVAFRKAPVPVPIPFVVKLSDPVKEVIGTSLEGRAIESYTFGTGGTHLAFVGGVHGGYEWNSVLLAYKFLDYLTANPASIPANLKVTVIPSANPDGVYKVTGKEGRFLETDVSTDKEVLASARFNANGVDLNRNFDCKWKPKSMWQNKTVSAGVKTFSEPEAEAIRQFISKTAPTAVIFWHSQAGAVYASQCEKGILPETLTLMNTYAGATDYKAVKTFDAYETTGASEDWLASIGIPAITVELTTHETVEFEENLAGVKALFEYYRKK